MEPTDRTLLEFAGRTYLRAGAVERAISEELGLTSVVFWSRVSRLLDDPPAELTVEFGPTIVRLRRIRAAGQRQRIR